MALAEQTTEKLDATKSNTQQLKSELGVILEKLYEFVER